MGKSMLEGKIAEELNYFIVRLKEFEGPMDPRFTVQITVANVIGSIVWGCRSEYDDPKFLKSIELMIYNFRVAGNSGALIAFPFLQ